MGHSCTRAQASSCWTTGYRSHLLFCQPWAVASFLTSKHSSRVGLEPRSHCCPFQLQRAPCPSICLPVYLPTPTNLLLWARRSSVLGTNHFLLCNSLDEVSQGGCQGLAGLPSGGIGSRPDPQVSPFSPALPQQGASFGQCLPIAGAQTPPV